MMRTSLLLAALALLAHPAAILAQDEPAEEPSTETPDVQNEQPAAPAPSDPEFEALARSFRVIYESIRNARGVLEEDRPAIGGFRDRVEAYLQEHPDHDRAVALALQLSLWLEDRDRASELYQRLVELRSGDVDLAFGRLNFQLSGEEEPDEEAQFQAYRDLFERFPDDPRVRLVWAEQLKGRMRYSEAEAVLQEGDFDPSENPDAWLTLVYTQFVEHKFDEALETYQAIPVTAFTDPDLRREYETVRDSFQQYPQFWSEEQELRSREEAAGDLPIVEMQTTKGPIVLQLFENQAPNTVANFIYLARQGFYDQTSFDRYLPELVIEGGDPETTPGTEGEAVQGGPGYTIPDEHRLEGARKHFRDSIGMDRGRQPNSAGSRFYLTHRPIPQRNNSYTVFGRVLDGIDVVRSLREDDSIIMMVVRQQRDHDYVPDTIPLPEAASPVGSPNAPDAPMPESAPGEGEDSAEQPGGDADGGG